MIALNGVRSKLVSSEGQAVAALPFRPYDTADNMGWRHQQWGKVQLIFMESPRGRFTTYDPEILEPYRLHQRIKCLLRGFLVY